MDTFHRWYSFSLWSHHSWASRRQAGPLQRFHIYDDYDAYLYGVSVCAFWQQERYPLCVQRTLGILLWRILIHHTRYVSFLSVKRACTIWQDSVCVGKTCDPKDYGQYYGTLNFFISFSLLIAIPTSGTMVEKMGTQALSGLLTGIIALGLCCLIAARAFLIGEWFAIKTKIWVQDLGGRMKKSYKLQLGTRLIYLIYKLFHLEILFLSSSFLQSGLAVKSNVQDEIEQLIKLTPRWTGKPAGRKITAPRALAER